MENYNEVNELNATEEAVPMVLLTDEELQEKERKETFEKMTELQFRVYNMIGVYYKENSVTEEKLNEILEIVKKENETAKLLYVGGLIEQYVESHCYTFVWIEDGEIISQNVRVEKFV